MLAKRGEKNIYDIQWTGLNLLLSECGVEEEKLKNHL